MYFRRPYLFGLPAPVRPRTRLRQLKSTHCRIGEAFADHLSGVHTTPRRESTIQLKRVYDKPEPNDGARFLVDRLWPRGLKKTEVHLDTWAKEAGPSDQLRQWFAHDPKKWADFQRRYFLELNEHPDTWKPILDEAKHAAVTLLYSARDAEPNNAAALKQFLAAKLAHKKIGPAADGETA